MHKANFLVLAILVIFLSCFISCSKKQYTDKKNGSRIENQHEEEVLFIVDHIAQFPGGESNMMKWLDENIKYPKEAVLKGTEGSVMVRFIIDSKGNIKSPEIIRSVDPILDQEALRVVQSMPAWIPAEHKGKKVSMYYVLPLRFKLTRPQEIPSKTS